MLHEKKAADRQRLQAQSHGNMSFGRRAISLEKRRHGRGRNRAGQWLSVGWHLMHHYICMLKLSHLSIINSVRQRGRLGWHWQHDERLT